MGVYTVRGGAELDARIDGDLRQVAEALRASKHAALYRALVLIGGYGRGEGTPYLRDGRQLPFNDYDLVVVSGPLPRAARRRVQEDLHELEAVVTRAVGLPVDLCLYSENVLRRAEFSLLNFEMKYGHKVVWGDPDVLRAMPEYAKDAIPLSEGTRLLMNRGKLLLDIRRRLRAGGALSDEEWLRFLKFLFKADLAFGDCALLISGAYDVSYAVKRERIGAVDLADAPAAAELVERYRAAIALKEWGDYGPLQGLDLASEFEAMRRRFVAFLAWYEGRRLHADVRAPLRYADALARAGGGGGRLRHAALNLALLRGGALRAGPRWLLAHPRQRVYAALPLVLGATPQPAALARLLGSDAAGAESGEQKFYALRARFS